MSENFRRCSSNSQDCHWLGFQSQLVHFMADFEHREIFFGSKSKLGHFKADVDANFRRRSSDSKDCHLLGLQSQLDYLMTYFGQKKLFYRP